MSIQQFFYDGQIRRYLVQFIRIFSNLQIQSLDSNGNPYLQRVPVRMAATNRQAEYMLMQGTDNTMITFPIIAVSITGIEYNPEWRLNPTNESSIDIRERKYDPLTGQLSTQQGNALTIKRMEPVPYVLKLRVDIATTNLDNKFQLLEQIQVKFNPSVEIQATDNYVDWTSLTYAQLEQLNWSNKAIPVGSSTDQLDVASLDFKMPIWITPPAKVMKLGVINTIITNIYNASGGLSDDIFANSNDLIFSERLYITPLAYKTLFYDGVVQLLPYNATVNSGNNIVPPYKTGGNLTTWQELIQIYGGEYRPGITQLIFTNQAGIEISGTVTIDDTQPDLLNFAVNEQSLPTNTLAPIDAVIDPSLVGPAQGLPAATMGTRYLITTNIGSVSTPSGHGPVAWRGIDGTDLIANANDIIQYTGLHWVVSFDSTANNDTVEYVTNITTGTQYEFTQSKGWTKSVEGEYQQGEWSILI